MKKLGFTFSLLVWFTFLNVLLCAQTPAITEFAPTFGPVGTTVTIDGVNFDPTPANNIVYFGAVRAVVNAASSMQLMVTAPVGTTYEPIFIICNGRSAYSHKPFITTLSGASSPSFAPLAVTNVNATPKDIKVADVNNDGNPDVLVVNQDANTVSVRLGDATGSFSGSTEISVGSFPQRLAVADVNNDGNFDFLTSNLFANTVSVRIGDGTGNFSGSTDFPVGNSPFEVVVADVNLDGYPDMLCAASSVSLRLGDGTGNFPSHSVIDVGPFPTSTVGIFITDINLDGKPDLLAANAARDEIAVRLGDGTGGFSGTNTIAGAGTGVFAGDLNHDGFPDVIASGSSATVLVRLGDGLGGFSGSETVNIPPSTGRAILADVNSDGNPDLITPHINNSEVSIRIGNGLGNFSSSIIDIPTVGSNSHSFVADVNLDGKQDILIPNPNHNRFSIALNIMPTNPTITSFTPASGPFGTTVTITGTNFDPTPTNNTVKFNGVPAATPSAASATSLTVTVPAAATSGPISVETVQGTATTTLPFIVNSDYTPFGNTIELDGSLDRVEVVDNPALRTTSMTLEAWIKVATTQSYGVVAGKPVGSGTQNSYAIWFESGKFAGGVNPLGLATGLTFDWVPTIGQWYHVALTYDNDTQMQVLYLNGAIVASGSKSTPVYDSQPFLIGTDMNWGSIGGQFPGHIDEVRLWNIVRTQAEIQSTMDNTLIGNEPGLAAYYRLDEVNQGAGITVANSATATGSTLNGLTYGTLCTPIFTRTLPTISSFSPSGAVGASVTITGTNFLTPLTTSVTINGIPATIVTSTATSLVVTVPPGATTGLIEVTIGCNSVTSATNFIVCTVSAPSATGNTGCSGTSITLFASGGSAGQYRWYTVASGGTHDASQTNGTFGTPALTATTSFFVSINDGACESARTEVVATVEPLPTAPGVQPVNQVCPGSDVTLTATGGTNGNYRWYDGTTPISGQVNSILLVSNLTSTKIFQVAIYDGTCESSKASVTVTVQNCTAPVVASTTATAFIEGIVTIDLQELVTDDEDNLDPARLQITTQPASGAPATLSGFELQINYAGFPFIGEDEVGIEVCDLTDLCSTQQITIELGGDIAVYNGLSPNGDGLNEFFKIQYIDILPETKANQVFIYNRWGDEVFSIQDYNNNDRVFKGDSKSGKKLPTGTYFYKVVFSSDKKTITGFLELKY